MHINNYNRFSNQYGFVYINNNLIHIISALEKKQVTQSVMHDVVSNLLPKRSETKDAVVANLRKGLLNIYVLPISYLFGYVLSVYLFTCMTLLCSYFTSPFSTASMSFHSFTVQRFSSIYTAFLAWKNGTAHLVCEEGTIFSLENCQSSSLLYVSNTENSC